MANTTSGTVTFDKTFAVDEIIEESLLTKHLLLMRLSKKLTSESVYNQ